MHRKKGVGHVVRVGKQIGSSNQGWDLRYAALPPGKRVSRAGSIYWETRKNRSDNPGSRT